MSRLIHDYFGLTYAQYLVIPRTVLQSMPDEWQTQFVELLGELGETYEWPENLSHSYRVTLHHPDLGIFEDAKRADNEEEADDLYEQAWGEPLRDPLADYERGRRRL